ncbi:MAG: hypothetical protein RML84_11600, partial [Anaerolineae bacterium]|nr:hypothetical protein [Anaerolineae bacterium]
SVVHHYRYCYAVATSPACTPSTDVGTSTSVTVTGLAAGTTYRWQVRACADSACSVFTDADAGHWLFTTGTPPGPFNKSAPSNGSNNQA